MRHEITMTISSFPDRDMAMKVGKILVEKRLAACVQVTSPVTSIYMWKGEVHEDPEVLLFIKTTAHKTPEVIQEIRAHHPYEVPEIISTPVIEAFEGYVDWIKTTIG